MNRGLLALVLLEAVALLWVFGNLLLALGAVIGGLLAALGWLGWRTAQLSERLIETSRELRETQRAAGMVSRSELEQRVREGGGVYFPEDYR